MCIILSSSDVSCCAACPRPRWRRSPACSHPSCPPWTARGGSRHLPVYALYYLGALSLNEYHDFAFYVQGCRLQRYMPPAYWFFSVLETKLWGEFYRYCLSRFEYCWLWKKMNEMNELLFYPWFYQCPQNNENVLTILILVWRFYRGIRNYL